MIYSPHNIPLFTACEAIVCDLDGTLYLEDEPIAGAAEFLHAVLAGRRRLFYFTNNTSMSRRSWLEKLRALNFPIDDHQLITSADCADAYLKRSGLFPRIYLVGNQDLRRDFEERGFRCLREDEALGGEPAAVVLSFDTELTYEKIVVCHQLLSRGLPYIATHPDILCPVGRYVFKPDIGSFIALFEVAGGRKPIIVGKPTAEAVRFITEKAHVNAERIAFIGDRLYTDMRMAAEAGMVGVLVLSGETTIEMQRSAFLQPQLVVDSVADLTACL